MGVVVLAQSTALHWFWAPDFSVGHVPRAAGEEGFLLPGPSTQAQLDTFTLLLSLSV